MYYTIHNKLNGANLKHPKIGIWNTSSLDEARDMLAACKEYLTAAGLDELKDQFVVIDIDTHEEFV
jgi:predicted membrane-bound mannosyltransferase